MKRFRQLRPHLLLNLPPHIKYNPPSLFGIHSTLLRKFNSSNNQSTSQSPTAFNKNEKLFTSHHPIHITKKQENLKLLEEQTRKLNLSVLRRELFNDCMQLSLKYMAWKSASLHNAPTFLAELTRSSIDCLNHILLYTINSLSIAPSPKYPYGMEKIKNAVALIPACLFFYFGMSTIYSSYIEFMYNPIILAEEHGSSLKSIIMYIASFSIEVGIICKNIWDSTTPGPNEPKIDISTRLKNLFKKKDPLLQVILYENAITLVSTSIPLICSGVGMFYPIPWLDTLGSFLLGVIQLFIVFELGEQNFPILIGEGLDNATLEEIIKIMKSNPYVTQVKNVRTILIGPNKFKLVAEITYELDKLTKIVLEDYTDIIDQITYLQDSEDRQDAVEAALTLLPKRFMKEIQIQNNQIEETIMQRFTNCVHIDLEIDHNQLVNYSDDIEKVKSFSIMDLEKNPLKYDPWIDESINRFLGKNFGHQIQSSKSNIDQKDSENVEADFIDHWTDTNLDHIDKWLANTEDERFEILKEHLDKNESRYQDEDFTSDEKKI